MTLSKKTRVLIVDDSAFMRKVLQGIIASDPQLEVCGEARDGRDAVTQTETLKPDVISMDINMPHVDGLQATEIIMSSNPRPILIVSSESREGADVTLKALELGAIDFVAKPSGGIDLDMSSVKEELCRKLKMAAKVRVVRTATRSKLQHEVASSSPRVRARLKEWRQRSAGSSRSGKCSGQKRGEISYHRVGILHRRAGYADEVYSIFSQGFSWSSDPGAAHAGKLYRPIQQSTGGSVTDQGERGGSRRNYCSGAALCLSRLASPARFAHGQNFS